jgi:D-3-phosphoglycerate dehydrogenase / 2-oxoglutarate reductase
MWLCVHTDPPPGNTLEAERAELARVGARLEARPCRSQADLLEAVTDADAVLNTIVPITPAVIAAMTRCRVIVRSGIGVDNVDVAAASAAGIVVANVPDASVEEVSNHALALLVACSRKIVLLDRSLRAGTWSRALFPPMGTLYGQTLGLVGFGRIARALAAKAQALSMRIIATDPLLPPEDIRRANAEPASLERLLAESDFLSLHVPLTPETHHLIGTAQLRSMKPSAYLINTARGPLVDEAALAAALQAGTIAGAGLDVFEQEPLAADSPLLGLDNVVITPHAAAYSDAGIRELRRRTGEAAADVLRGLWPRGVANPGVSPRFPLSPRP